MKLPRQQFLHFAAGAGALTAVSGAVRAKSYPTRPVRIIVPFARWADGYNCSPICAKVIGKTEKAGVENVPGDGGNVGLGRAAHAPADGYTLVAIDQIRDVMNPRLYHNAPYDPAKDFDAVALAVATT